MSGVDMILLWRKGGRRAGGIIVCKTTNILNSHKEMFAKRGIWVKFSSQDWTLQIQSKPARQKKG